MHVLWIEVHQFIPKDHLSIDYACFVILVDLGASLLTCLHQDQRVKVAGQFSKLL